jgi:Ankyrin repeats (many copies)
LDTAIMSVDPKTQSLFEAIAATNYHRVKLAIDSGAAINSPNDRGQTPLALACRQGNLEIVDLLVAAGAQMQPQPDANDRISATDDSRGSAGSVRSLGADLELTPSPANIIEIPFENLIDPIDRPAANNQATQIEQLMPIRSPQPPSENPTAALRQMAANWQDLSSDAEATYTFDLDEVFAANDRADRAADTIGTEIFAEDMTVSSLQQPLNNSSFIPDETYAFDLSVDLDRMTIAAAEDADRLAMPIEWGDNETYVVDDFAQLLPEIERQHDPIERQVAQIDRLFESEGETYVVDDFAQLLPDIERQHDPIERQVAQIDRLFESEGETYVVDDFAQLLPDIERQHDPIERQFAQIDRLFESEGETYVVDDFTQLLPDIDRQHDPIAQQVAQIDRLFESEDETDRFVPQAWEEGETYAIDLGNLYPSETQIDTDLDLRVDRHLLSDLDSSLFPVIGGEDEPDFDPDTQTTTDIFGHSVIQPVERSPLVPAYQYFVDGSGDRWRSRLGATSDRSGSQSRPL